MNAETPPEARVPSEVAQAAQAVKEERPDYTPPPWANRFVWQSAWKLVVVIAFAALAIVVVMQLRHLIGVLVISLFFALAIIPGVEALVRRFSSPRSCSSPRPSAPMSRSG